MSKMSKPLLAGAAASFFFATVAAAEEAYLRCELVDFVKNPLIFRVDLQRSTAVWSSGGIAMGTLPVRITRDAYWIYDIPGSRVLYWIDRTTGDIEWRSDPMRRGRCIRADKPNL